jgi:hypothetical protein
LHEAVSDDFVLLLEQLDELLDDAGVDDDVLDG